jgi:hypothetical protein
MPQKEKDMGVYGDKLRAEPQDDIPEASSLDDVDAFAGPDTYFHGAKQRALWAMGDYGAAADALENRQSSHSWRPHCISRNCGSCALKTWLVRSDKIINRRSKTSSGISMQRQESDFMRLASWRGLALSQEGQREGGELIPLQKPGGTQ